MVKFRDDNTSNTQTTLHVRQDGTGDILNLYQGDSDEVFTVLANGNVGIGTSDPKYTLDVIGNIRATGSVYYGGTSGNANGTAYNKPDFVFEERYKVMSTEQVAKHLEQENSLPWITSLKQEKEENGPLIDMTRMSFETVEAVENLQIQIIELAKIIKEQQRQIGYLLNKTKH